MEAFNKVKRGYFLIISFFLPLFLVIFSSPIFSASRVLVLVAATAGVFALWIARNFLNKGLVFSKFSFLLPLVLFAVVILVSTFMIATIGGANDALWGKSGMFLVLIMFSFGSIQVLDENDVKSVAGGLAIFAFLAALLLVLASFSWLNRIIPAALISEKELVRGETAVYLLIFFLAVGALFAVTIAQKLRISAVAGAAACVVGTATLAFQLSNAGNRPIFLPFSSGWAITIEIFKNFKFLLAGSGFNQFGFYSNYFRTAQMNSGNLAFLRFGENANVYLDLLSSAGVLGFAAFATLLFKYFTSYVLLWRRNDGKMTLESAPRALFFGLPVAVLAVIFLFLPLSPILAFLFFLCLAASAAGLRSAGAMGYESHKLNLVGEDGGIFAIQSLQMHDDKRRLLAPKILAAAAAIVFILVLWNAVYAVVGEVHYFGVLRAYALNAGNRAYEEANLAVGANPRNDAYRTLLSDVNFRLALVLNAQKKLTDNDRQKIAILVNQAIAAAQKAAEINPTRVTNWENLGNIYQHLIATDKNAANLAVSAYAQAVVIDPRDAALRVRFAQLLYAVKAYKEAAGQLAQAINIKSDYANAYYNLGLVYEALNDKENAKKALSLAMSFVKKGSGDEKKLKEELEKAEKITASAETAAVAPTPEPTIPVAPTPATESAETVKPQNGQEQKLTSPEEQPKLENMNKELLQLNQPTPTGAVVSPSPTSTR